MALGEWVHKNRRFTAVGGAIAFLLIALMPTWLSRMWFLFSSRDFVSVMNEGTLTRALVGPAYGWLTVLIGLVLIGLAGLAVFAPPPAPVPVPRPRFEPPPRTRQEASAAVPSAIKPPVLVAVPSLEAAPLPPKPQARYTDWNRLGEDFRRIRDTAVRADWTRTHSGETWKVCGGMMLANQDCEGLCKIAGDMLLASPTVAAVIAPSIRSEVAPAWRWLRYVREVTSTVDTDPDGRASEGPAPTGSIEDLTEVSARLCADCSALQSLAQ